MHTSDCFATNPNDGGTAGGSGGAGGVDGSPVGQHSRVIGGTESGCSCQLGHGSRPGPVALALVVPGLFVLRRRRRG